MIYDFFFLLTFDPFCTASHRVWEFNPTKMCLATASYLKVLLSYPYKSADISRTWCSSVTVVTRPRVRMLVNSTSNPGLYRSFPYLQTGQTGRRDHPTSCPICKERSFPVDKKTGLRSRLLTSITEVKNTWSYTSTPH